MSLKFRWPTFTDAHIRAAVEALENGLNGHEHHAALVGPISVVELNLASKPPELELLEVSDVSRDHFRGVFRLSYDGAAHIVLRTKVHANPINPHRTPSVFTQNNILAANKQLIVPLEIRISELVLSGIAVVDYSAQRGVTLALKNDPLKSVRVSTTFDEQPSVRRMIQGIIEEQLRALLNRTIPRAVHLISLGSSAGAATAADDVELEMMDFERTPFMTPSTSPILSHRQTPVMGGGAADPRTADAPDPTSARASGHAGFVVAPATASTPASVPDTIRERMRALVSQSSILLELLSHTWSSRPAGGTGGAGAGTASSGDTTAPLIPASDALVAHLASLQATTLSPFVRRLGAQERHVAHRGALASGPSAPVTPHHGGARDGRDTDGDGDGGEHADPAAGPLPGGRGDIDSDGPGEASNQRIRRSESNQLHTAMPRVPPRRLVRSHSLSRLLEQR